MVRDLLCFLLVALAAPSALAVDEEPESPASEGAATAAAGYGRAFGRIEYIEDGKLVAISAGFFESTYLTLFVRSARTGKVRYMDIGGDGSFIWPIEAGEHVIVGYQFQRTKVNNRASRVARMAATFSVPQPGQAAYIGDLRIDNAHRVVDAYAQTLEGAKPKLAEAGFEPVKSMMRFERPPGAYAAVIGICTERWKLACSKEFRGVEPVQPVHLSTKGLPGPMQLAPVTETLSPVLEWKPATSSG